ncbi:hypothetical protein [Flavivirga algicola]|uniref:DUF4836 family protein n=1 Tax=Flavivirga algicola TaxID=2729136 RepID=A0ABX1RXR4_9FLAO|nr:hypothetical protein [Flavivirga algicola]NMH88366.1 DUF4836 family protein [Flavivirga algicola]
MKKILLFIAVFVSYTNIAQNIESKIPNSTEAIISINGDRLIELVSIAEFDDYNFAKKMFNELNRKNDSTFTVSSVKDLGFDIDSKAFYFHKRTDSISYHNFMVKLTDRNKFENLLPKKKRESIISEGGMHIKASNGAIAVWNDHLLLFTGYEKQRSYFKENEERLMAKPENQELSYYKVKKRMTSQWAKTYALDIFRGNGEASILNNKNYRANKDENAVASVWVRNYGHLLNGAMSAGMSGMGRKGGMPFFKGFEPTSDLYGFKSVVANLYIDEDAIKLTTEMEVNSDWQKIIKNIYNSKMNHSFYDYFNQNEALAYMSFSMDIQALLEEYPALMTRIYGGITPKYKEEMDLTGAFFSLLIDEEAIGELMTGDVLFVLNDFGEKEVTYTSYEFDEDYKRKELTKTKNEVVPDFTIMIGSKKEKLLNKVVRLGVKHGLFENTGGYYKMNLPDMKTPVDLYAVVKNDILFFTTSEERISNIVNNRFVKDLGKHKKLIKNNNTIFYINGQELMSRMPFSELNSKARRYFNYTKDNFKDAYFKGSKVKGNKVHSEIKINTSSSQGNSLKAFLNFIEVLAK